MTPDRGALEDDSQAQGWNRGCTAMSRTADDARRWELFRKEVSEGLLYTHARLGENTQMMLEAASFLYGLIEILSERDLLSIEELDERKRIVAKRLMRKNGERGVGVLLQEPEVDKHAFEDVAEIDCAERLSLCRAACCRLPFALSRQDIREGVVRWELGDPYIIAQGQDGYCTHLDRGSFSCTIREHRPVPCRAFDCRGNKRIWLDFGNRRINPEILNSEWPRCVESPDGGGGEGVSP